MALTVTFEEEYLDRGVDISNESFTQDFVFFIKGNFLDEANDDATYGTDDDVQALNGAYSIVPPFRTMPTYFGGSITLKLNTLGIRQMEPDLWKVTAQYSGSDRHSGGSGDGPGTGEPRQWSENFVQLQFNVAASQRNRKQSINLALGQRANGVTGPYTAGEPAPMGLTEEGPEGVEVYEREFSFGLTRYMQPNQLTFAYARLLYRMATTINLDTFFGFPKGSVLFLEADAAGSLVSTVPVNYEFKVRPNFKFSKTLPTLLADPLTNNVDEMFDRYYEPQFPDAPIDVAEGVTPTIPGNTFSGWSAVDYQWSYKEENNVQKLVGFIRNVHRVYEFQDFRRFGL